MPDSRFGSEVDPLLSRHTRHAPTYSAGNPARLFQPFPISLAKHGPLLLAATMFAALFIASSYWAPAERRISTSAPEHLSVPHVPLSFLALGDWGRQGQFGQRRVAKALADTVQNTIQKNGYNPHYILSTGDNFYKSGVASIKDADFNRSYTDVYDHVSLTSVPWYSILGNHDHLGSITAQVEFSSLEPRWNMPAPYYAHRFADNLLAIFLDTTPFVTGDEGDIARNQNRQKTAPQLRWLQQQLAQAPPSSYFFIIGHHNMYTMSSGGHLGSPELRHELEPLLMPYRERIIAYISGHEHSLMHMQPYPSTDAVDVEKRSAPYSPIVDHFISGAGSKLDDITVPVGEEATELQNCCGVIPRTNDSSVPRTVWGESVHGFFAFRFDGRLFKATAIDENGKSVYEYEKSVA